jgi:hypothetical protein
MRVGERLVDRLRSGQRLIGSRASNFEMEVTDHFLSKVQRILDLSFFSSTQFRTNKSLGKIGVGGFLLGILFGCSVATLIFSLILVATLSSPPNYIYTLVISHFRHSQILPSFPNSSDSLESLLGFVLLVSFPGISHNCSLPTF